MIKSVHSVLAICPSCWGNRASLSPIVGLNMFLLYQNLTHPLALTLSHSHSLSLTLPLVAHKEKGTAKAAGIRTRSVGATLLLFAQRGTEGRQMLLACPYQVSWCQLAPLVQVLWVRKRTNGLHAWKCIPVYMDHQAGDLGVGCGGSMRPFRPSGSWRPFSPFVGRFPLLR